MACNGTYVGQCCDNTPPPVDDRLRALAVVKGFATFTKRLNQDFPGDRQLLHNGLRLRFDWDFTITGVNFSGGYIDTQERLGTGHNDPFVSTRQGDTFPTLAGQQFRFVWDTIEPALAIGRIQKRNAQLGWDDVGTGVATLFGSLPTAHSLAIAAANSYDPATGTWDGGRPLEQFGLITTNRAARTVYRPRSSPTPGLDIGTIAPTCGALPPQSAPLTVNLFAIGGELTACTATVNRNTYAPRTGKQFKLVKTYTPECGFAGPPVLVECDSVNAESGVDITPSEMRTGYQSVSVAVTEFPLGASPC